MPKQLSKATREELAEIANRSLSPGLHRHREGGKCPKTKTLFKGTLVSTVFPNKKGVIGSRSTNRYKCSECGETYLEESRC